MQNGVDAVEQFAAGEGFLDDGDAVGQGAVLGEDRFGVAGHVEHGNAGPPLLDVGGDFVAHHLGHDHVGEEQVDRAGMGLREVDRFGAAGGGQHVVAGAGQHAGGDLAQVVFVFGHENGFVGWRFGGGFGGRENGGGGVCAGGCFDGGQDDGDGGAD